MSKAYLITSGEYSEYSVDYVFSSEEKAREFIANVERFKIEHKFKIEEFELDPEFDSRYSLLHDKVDRGYQPYYVDINAEGIDRVLTACPTSLYDLNTFYESSVSVQYKGFHSVRLLARNEEEAKKIAVEKFQEYVAKKLLSAELLG